MKHSIHFVLALGLALGLLAQDQSVSIYNINGRIPLGVESFRLQPDNRDFYLVASAENEVFEGMRRVTDDAGRDHLVDREGHRVLFYPSGVRFRLTASSREKLSTDQPFDTHPQVATPDLLSHLRFRIKVFHALAYWYVKPRLVENIGVPTTVPYDERIYLIGFDLGRIPIDDRVVMEVLAPSGERLCKFHLDLL
ncbi:MAG TPA: hypothetical protein VMU28_00100 [Terriglobales bacterium]|nr:hypothetical protein [Terriglobales bacterium]